MRPTPQAILLVVLALALGTGSPAAAGDAASPLETLRKSNEPLQRFVLDNGMICLVKEDHSAPVAAVQIWVGTGAVDENEYLGAGLSHFVEHMIFKGTPTRPVGEITREINDAGGEINAYTAHDRTVFHVTMPSKSWKVGLDVLADAVMSASFPKNEWARERDVILREFAMGRDNPEREVGELLWSTAYRVHPYQFPIIGYEDVFKSTTRDDLVTFFRRNYVPDNMIAVVAGDVNAAEVKAQLDEVFKAFTRKARAPGVLPAEPPQIAPRFARKTGAYQVSRLLMAYHTVALTHPDVAALDVLANIVGSGRSSRLVRKIKEEQKLVYDVDAWSATPKDPGLFGISATFDPTNETAVIQAIQQEIDRWAAEPFTGEELGKAKQTLLVGELSGLQTMDGQAYSYASGEFYAADPRFSELYLRNVDRIDAAALTSVVSRHLVPDNRTLVVLSPETAAGAPSASAPAAAVTNIQKLTLSTGVPLIVREDHRLPFVYFCAAFRGGLLAESEKNNGITQLMADLLTRGTVRRLAEDIAQTVERLGGSLSPFAGRNSFGLQARGLSRDAETFMDLLSDCLLHPVFPEDELEKQRVVQLAAIRQQRERPFFVAQEALRQTIFPGHPYRWTSEGTRETVQALKREDLVEYFRRLVVAGNLVLSVFGDITPEQARQMAERALGRLPAGPAPDLAQPPAEPQLPARIKQREKKQQTILLVGFPGVTLRDPRVDALAVIETALSGLSSELSTAARERRGLVYYIGASDMPGLEPGLFAAYAGTREETAGEVERLIDAELGRIAKRGLSAEELERAREQIIAAQQMSLQDNGGLAQTCALDELYGLGYGHSLTTEARMRALAADEIRAAAASIFKKERQAVSLVLPERTEPGKEVAP
ncbi:MAG: pitrilysin family protein [Verrucomicrobiota bacterium]